MKWAAAAVFCLAASAFAQVRVGEVTTDTAGPRNVSSTATAAAGGAEVSSGSAVSASGRSATLKLDRGGAVRICPRTTLTASSSPSGRELMLAVNSGTLELNYDLGANSDALITPDLRLSIAGPASVRVAVDVLRSGDVCVASLAGNNAAVVVSELAGEGSYQVRPGQQIVFAKGSIAQPHSAEGLNCGCPPAPAEAPVQRAEMPSPAPQTALPAPRAEIADRSAQLLMSELPPAAAPPWTNPTPASSLNDMSSHLVVEVSAPMIYNGDRPSPPTDTLAAVRIFRSADDVLLFPPLALPPQQPKIAPSTAQAAAGKPNASPARTASAKPQGGFLHRLGAFFSGLFR